MRNVWRIYGRYWRVSGEEFSAELGEVSLHGDTRDCTRPHSVKKKNRGGQGQIELISNLPTPKCVKYIRSFLGHAGFYRRFIRDFSVIARPLCNFLAKEVPFAWSRDCEDTFDKLKTMLVSSPIM